MSNIIFFDTMKFRKGVNVTVRRGKKWMQKDPINIDVVGKRLMQFKCLSLSPEEIKNLHDSDINNYEQLLELMQKLYDDFCEDEEVTVIWFNM